MADDNFFDEWSSGVSLANPGPSNEFFEEFQGNLDKPADFHVDPEQIPANPIAHHSDPEATPIQPVPPTVEDDGPEVLEIDGLGTVSLEKSSKGWKAVVSSNDRGISDQNFYGPNLKQLVLNFAKNALNGTIAIRKLKTEKLLGGTEPDHQPTPQRIINPSVSTLTADDIIGIKNELADNPDKAISDWMQKKFGSNLDELAEALKAAPEAKRLVDAQTVKADTAEVIDDFLKNNQDYSTEYNTAENGRSLVRRLAKVHLKKTVSKDLKVNIDDVIYELYKSGNWTEENLEAAKEELIDAGALQRVSTSVPATPQSPQPAAPQSASEPPKRIATNPGQPAGLGLPARGSTSVVIPEEKPLSDINLSELPMDQLRKIAMAQLQAMKQGRQ